MAKRTRSYVKKGISNITPEMYDDDDNFLDGESSISEVIVTPYRLNVIQAGIEQNINKERKETCLKIWHEILEKVIFRNSPHKIHVENDVYMIKKMSSLSDIEKHSELTINVHPSSKARDIIDVILDGEFNSENSEENNERMQIKKTIESIIKQIQEIEMYHQNSKHNKDHFLKTFKGKFIDIYEGFSVIGVCEDIEEKIRSYKNKFPSTNSIPSNILIHGLEKIRYQKGLTLNTYVKLINIHMTTYKQWKNTEKPTNITDMTLKKVQTFLIKVQQQENSRISDSGKKKEREEKND